MKVDSIRWPDEIRITLRGISRRIEKIGTVTDSGISLRDLSEAEELSMDLFRVLSPVDEIIENINVVISDLEQLASNCRAFDDVNPMRRYKILVRLFFYEFARFEDVHARFTQFMKVMGLATKAERRQLMRTFYEYIEPLVELRNTLSHGDPDWSGAYSHEITMLVGAELAGMHVIGRDGSPITWDAHLGPRCKEAAEAFTDFTAEMRTFWNMTVAHLVAELITRGLLAKAAQPFVPENLFNKRVRRT